MSAEKKITVMLPQDLLEKAMKASGQGITSTLKKGLELVAARNVYNHLLKLRGKYKDFEFDLETSRKNRDEK